MHFDKDEIFSTKQNDIGLHVYDVDESVSIVCSQASFRSISHVINLLTSSSCTDL